jgi:hypothetical protein
MAARWVHMDKLGYKNAKWSSHLVGRLSFPAEATDARPCCELRCHPSADNDSALQRKGLVRAALADSSATQDGYQNSQE